MSEKLCRCECWSPGVDLTWRSLCATARACSAWISSRKPTCAFSSRDLRHYHKHSTDSAGRLDTPSWSHQGFLVYASRNHHCLRRCVSRNVLRSLCATARACSAWISLRKPTCASSSHEPRLYHKRSTDYAGRRDASIMVT